MYIPEFPVFRNLSREDKTLLDGLFHDSQPQISELTFTNLFVWNTSEPVLLSRFEESIILERTKIRDGRPYLLPPQGRQITTDFLRAIRTQNPKNHLPPLYGVISEMADVLTKEGWKVTPEREDWDYVYLTNDLADLPGDKYHSKRNLVSRCLAENDCRYAAIGPREIADCLNLQTSWCNLRKCDENPGLKGEDAAIKAVFENYDFLGIRGGAVYVNDRLEAFTVGERLNRETAVIHFEKANPQIVGLYQVINQWFCQKALRDFRFVNREQDLGVPGLRKAKSSYHPHHMVEKFTVEL